MQVFQIKPLAVRPVASGQYQTKTSLYKHVQVPSPRASFSLYKLSI